jgi:hypothetical protein
MMCGVLCCLWEYGSVAGGSESWVSVNLYSVSSGNDCYGGGGVYPIHW